MGGPARGTRERLERIVPIRCLAQIDTGKIFRAGHYLGTVAHHIPWSADQSLRVQGRAPIVITRHPIEDLHEFVRIIVGSYNALERMAARASGQKTLLLLRPWNAHDPFRIRELGREIFGLPEL